MFCLLVDISIPDTPRRRKEELTYQILNCLSIPGFIISSVLIRISAGSTGPPSKQIHIVHQDHPSGFSRCTVAASSHKGSSSNSIMMVQEVWELSTIIQISIHQEEAMRVNFSTPHLLLENTLAPIHFWRPSPSSQHAVVVLATEEKWTYPIIVCQSFQWRWESGAGAAGSPDDAQGVCDTNRDPNC